MSAVKTIRFVVPTLKDHALLNGNVRKHSFCHCGVGGIVAVTARRSRGRSSVSFPTGKSIRHLCTGVSENRLSFFHGRTPRRVLITQPNHRFGQQVV